MMMMRWLSEIIGKSESDWVKGQIGPSFPGQLFLLLLLLLSGLFFSPPGIIGSNHVKWGGEIESDDGFFSSSLGRRKKTNDPRDHCWLWIGSGGGGGVNLHPAASCVGAHERLQRSELIPTYFRRETRGNLELNVSVLETRIASSDNLHKELKN